MFKVNNKDVFIVTFEHISPHVLVILLFNFEQVNASWIMECRTTEEYRVSIHVLHYSILLKVKSREYKLQLFKKFVFYLMRFGMPVIDLANVSNIKNYAVDTFLEISNILFINLATIFIVYKMTPLMIWPKRIELQISISLSFRSKFCCKISMMIYGFEVFRDQPSNWRTKALTWTAYKSQSNGNFLLGKITLGTKILLKIQVS